VTDYEREPAAIEETLVAYAHTPIMLYQATASMPEDFALVAPAVGEWSIAQIVTHLWIVDGHALVTFAGAEPPDEEVMKPQNPRSFLVRRGEFELRRAAVVAALRNLPPDSWDTPYPFRSIERSAQALVAGFVRHDNDHLQQIVTTRRAVVTRKDVERRHNENA